MSLFKQIQQLISQDSNLPHQQPQKNNLHMYNHYQEMDQLQASAHSKKSHTVIQPAPEQYQQPTPKYNLFLPPLEEHKKPVEGNTSSINKRIIVKPVKEQIRETKLTIINLEDDIEEQIIEKTEKEEGGSINEEVVVNNKPFFPQKIEEQDNSFLQAQQNIKHSQPNKLVPVQIQKETNKEDQLRNAKGVMLFNRSKLLERQLPVKKNMFYDSEEKDEYVFGIPQVSSKSSLDTGLNVTSVMSSRDQLSSRNILNYPEKKRPKLPELKPYKQISNAQIFTVSSYQHLDQEKQKQSISIIKPKPLLISAQQITNVSEFVRQPIQFGRRLQCSLVRNKTCSKRFFLDYDLQTNDGQFLISCKKMPFCLNSTYNISLAKGAYDQKSEFFVGKVQGNFTGSIFNVFTYDLNSFQPKEMVATIYYKSSCSWCEEHYRQFELYVKSENCKYYELSGTQLEKGRSLKDLYEVESNRQLKMISKFINKPPKWNEKQQGFVINFRGKCKQGSVKNAVIINEDRPNQQVLLIAKQQSDKFAFDISHPFSPLIAFGLMITGFDFKLASQ